ncbi:MAG: Ig-like domain-containing protein [Lachnospiraceae bacterium]|nr:Ig-like domain-containing protein [Lachnospiraceae bacterium]
MKKITKIVSFLLVLTLLFTNCGLGNIEVEAAKKASKKPTKITLSDSKKNLAVGETFTLKVKSVKPANASKSVTWSSSRNKIATVSKKGKVKAKKTGSVTITAKSTVSKKVVAKCKIKVYKATKTLKLNSETSYELTVGQTQQLSAKVTNPKKGAAPIEWSSSDKKVAKVTSKGNVTAVAEGKAIITAKSGKKKVTVSIVVKKKETGNDTGNTPGTQNPGTGGNQPPGDTTGTGGTQNPGTQPGSGSGSGNTKPEDGANDDATSGDETVSDNTTTDNTDDDNNPTNGDTSEDDKEKDEEEEENSIIVHSGIWNGMEY